MNEFNIEYLDHFLAAVRKYMQLRGPYSQKELAELVGFGVSTMSRFLNKKTSELNTQLIAAIVAKLDIPFSEFIDFVDEQYEPQFKRLVKFKKNDGVPPIGGSRDNIQTDVAISQRVSSTIGDASRVTPSSNSRTASTQSRTKEHTVKDKLQGLSLRQRKFLEDFIALGIDERDLIVDVADKMMVYFKDKAL